MTVRTLRVISWRELSEVIPFTRQHVLRLEKVGKFPRRIRLGTRRVGWLYSEIEAWIALKTSERETQVTADEVDAPW